jgi:tRNA (guanosine-2'-O-)-methyltransferase
MSFLPPRLAEQAGPLVLVLATVACGAPRAAVPSAPRRAETSAAGLGDEQACTPSGPEICFDAIDNNCNGVIDEGCGLPTGVLEFVIAWGLPVDVDIEVTDPDGGKTPPDARGKPGKMLRDRDCPGRDNACRGQNTEHVYFPGDQPPTGTYRVVIRIGDRPGPGATFPIPVRWGVRIGARTYGATVILGSDRDEKVIEVLVDPDALPRARPEPPR